MAFSPAWGGTIPHMTPDLEGFLDAWKASRITGYSESKRWKGVWKDRRGIWYGVKLFGPHIVAQALPIYRGARLLWNIPGVKQALLRKSAGLAPRVAEQVGLRRLEAFLRMRQRIGHSRTVRTVRYGIAAGRVKGAMEGAIDEMNSEANDQLIRWIKSEGRDYVRSKNEAKKRHLPRKKRRGLNRPRNEVSTYG